jgi:hypothetical protein
MHKTILITTIVCFLWGCTSISANFDQCDSKSPDDFSRIDFQSLTDQVAAEFCLSEKGDIESTNPEDIILVPDYVEINSLETQSLGLILGEHLRVSLSKICNIPIRQVEMSKEFRLNSNGLTALTRDKNAISLPTVQAKTAIVGVYNLKPNNITLITKKINLQNSTVIKYSSKQVSWKCDVTNFYKRSANESIKLTFPQDEVSKLLNYTEGIDDFNTSFTFWYPFDSKECIYRKANFDNPNVKELKLNALVPSTLKVGYVQDAGTWYGPNNYMIQIMANGSVILASNKPRDINLTQSYWNQVFNKKCSGIRDYY